VNLNIKVEIKADGLEGAIHTLAQVLAGLDLPEIPQTQPKVEVTGIPEEKEETQKEEVKKEVKPTENTSGLTFEQVRVKLAEISQKGKQQELKQLITDMGAEKLSDIPEEKFADLIERAEAL